MKAILYGIHERMTQLSALKSIGVSKRQSFPIRRNTIKGFGLILILGFGLMVYQFTKPKDILVRLRYQSTDINFDFVDTGFSVEMLDENGFLISKTDTKGPVKSLLVKIPDRAEVLRIKKDRSMMMPNEVFVKDIAELDSLYIDTVIKMSLGDALNDEIRHSFAQRWYQFSVEEDAVVQFIAQANDSVFSPQMAIYDHVSLENKISGSANSYGLLADTTQAFLKSGIYYLKLRGFADRVGGYTLSSWALEESAVFENGKFFKMEHQLSQILALQEKYFQKNKLIEEAKKMKEEDMAFTKYSTWIGGISVSVLLIFFTALGILRRSSGHRSSHQILVLSDHEKIKTSDIVYIQAKGNYQLIYLKEGKQETTRCTQKELIAQLPSFYFVQTQRSYIVNLDYHVKHDNQSVYLKEHARVRISKTFLSEFEDRIQTYEKCNLLYKG